MQGPFTNLQIWRVYVNENQRKAICSVLTGYLASDLEPKIFPADAQPMVEIHVTDLLLLFSLGSVAMEERTL
jgi:hypothetical protein